jgi:hypothetical protein
VLLLSYFGDQEMLLMEKWMRWVPINGLPRSMVTKKIIDYKGLTLEFVSGEDTVKVFFKPLVYSYRVTDEGSRLKTLERLYEENGNKIITDWCFYNITDSAYLKWINSETGNMHDIIDTKHYAFITQDEFIDVLAVNPPELTIYKRGRKVAAAVTWPTNN